MTSNMSKSQKKIVEGDCSCSVDRISSLPENVLECVFNSMSVKDAARTCVLLTRWRYVWAHHPSLILDRQFWEDIIAVDSDRLSNKDYPDIVRKLLQHHVGYIRKFVFHVSFRLNPMPHTDIDFWLSSLCSRGLKELTLTTHGRNPYRVPSSVFSSSDLIELNLYFCVIKSGCFTNIKTLSLEEVTFDSSVVLTTPLLTFLELEKCSGILHFDISAPRLESLLLCDNDDLNLEPFLICMGIDYVFLQNSNENTYFKGCESFCLGKLLAAWPRISALDMDGSCFKYLIAGSMPSELGQLDLRSFSIQHLETDLEQMSWILCILKNSPLLRTLYISFGNSLYETPDIDESRFTSDLRIDRLDSVVMKYFTATPNEVVFAKILLQCAPVLEKMVVLVDDGFHAETRVKILMELLSLQHAFPKTKIVYEEY